MNSNHVDPEVVSRPDEAIKDEINERLWRERMVRWLDINQFIVEVKDGEALIYGHISAENNYALIEKIVREVPGVKAVQNNLVIDRDLVVEVSGALYRDERTRPLIIPVSARHGWITLGGSVPNRDLQCAVEEVAASVPSVRGVTALPYITGEKPFPARRALQPAPGATVYLNNNFAGIVRSVVISPRSRMVTHMIVDTARSVNDSSAPVVVVPVEKIEVTSAGGVRDGNIFIEDRSPELRTYPVYKEKDYIQPPAGWQPPFPYTRDEILWSVQEASQVKVQEEHRQEKKETAGVAGSLDR
ncbi:MAG: BON domain-containing protein [Chloroflexi bacterium]|jgi:osmotically-inducible protein OsmY|nr:BON domain-containing protein [Chloroflexota bacterium]